MMKVPTIVGHPFIKSLFILLMIGGVIFIDSPISAQSLNRSPTFEFTPNQFNPQIMGFEEGAMWAYFRDGKTREQIHLIKIDEGWQAKTAHSFTMTKNQSLDKGLVLDSNIAFLFKEKSNSEFKHLKGHLFDKNGDTLAFDSPIDTFQNPIRDFTFKPLFDSFLAVLVLTKGEEKAAKLHYLKLKPDLSNQFSKSLTIDTLVKPELLHFSSYQGKQAGLIQGKSNSELIAFHSFSDSTLNTTNLKHDSLLTPKAAMAIDRVNQQFLINGLYREEGSDYFAGISIRKEKWGKNSNTFYHTPFQEGLIEDVHGKKTTKEGLEKFRLQALIPRSDGGSILMLEHYRKDAHQYRNQGYFGSSAPTIRHYFYFEEIVILSLGPKGQIQWHNVHFKKQNTVNDEGEFSSFKPFIQKDRLLLLYNNFRGNHMNLLYYTLNRKGNLKGEILINGKNNPLKSLTTRSRQMDKNTIVIPVINEDDAFQFLRVHFND